MGRILIGTCSWTDPELISAGTFYPADVRTPEARLRHYAGVFPVVEVDSTYYGIPAKKTAEQWVQRTPSDFVFDVKAFRLLTLHWTEPRVIARELQSLVPPGARRFYWKDASEGLRAAVVGQFKECIVPLHDSHKLGLVIFQFPEWVGPKPEVYEHILAMKEALAPYSLAVEFRNRFWLNDHWREETLSWLRRHRLAFVAVDEPQGFASSMPPVVDVTAPDAYVRFHGRNAATWEAPAKTSADRFDWRYSPQELEEWVPKLRFLAEHADRIHVLFNTNRSDQGPSNARLLGALLGAGLMEQGPPSPSLQAHLGP